MREDKVCPPSLSSKLHEVLKRRKFKPKMRQNAFGGRAPPGPAGELSAPPDPLAAIGGAYF